MDQREPLLPCKESDTLADNFLAKLPNRIKTSFGQVAHLQLDFSKVSNLGEGEQKYYETQITMLRMYEEVDNNNSYAVGDEELDRQKLAQNENAMKISNLANAFLLAFKIYASVQSSSLAIATSTLDSLLDFVAGGILWFTFLSLRNVNRYKYPIGKLRVQPVGIIVFSAVMATLGFVVFVQALVQLTKDEPSEKMSFTQLLWLYAIMITATVIKLVLWICCRSSESRIVRAYAEDHYFDVITNVVGLVAAVLGEKLYWWMDPIGAVILSIYTITNWSRTVLENAASLVGHTAPPEVLHKLLYIVIKHSSLIKRVDRIHAYTLGVLYFVEVDIELSEDLSLKEAHAVGESLQKRLEEVSEVERAFVHLDHESYHKPEHTILTGLPSIEP